MIDLLYEDLVALDCERLPYGLDPQPLAVRTTVENGYVDFRIPCRRAVQGRGRRCRGTIEIHDGSSFPSGVLYRPASARFSVTRRSGRVRVRNTRSALPFNEAAIVAVRYELGDRAVQVRWTSPHLP